MLRRVIVSLQSRTMPRSQPLPPLSADTPDHDPLWAELPAADRVTLSAAYALYQQAIAATGPLGREFHRGVRLVALQDAGAYAIEGVRRQLIEEQCRLVRDLASWAMAPSGADSLAAVLSGGRPDLHARRLADLPLVVARGPWAGLSVDGLSIPVLVGSWYLRQPLTVGEVVACYAAGQGTLGWSGRATPAEGSEANYFTYSQYATVRALDVRPMLERTAPRVRARGMVEPCPVLPAGLRLASGCAVQTTRQPRWWCRTRRPARWSAPPTTSMRSGRR
jgi:hypothetical protein